MFSVPPPCDAQLGMIRPMHETDLPAVLSIENQLYDFPWSQRNFLDALEAPYDCQVYCVADQVLAYSIVMLVFDEAHLLNISVSKSQQGRGLGRFLLRHAMAAAQAQGMLSVLLEVRRSNVPALALYRRLDFALIGVRRAYYPAQQGREDALVLRCACAPSAAPVLSNSSSSSSSFNSLNSFNSNVL